MRAKTATSLSTRYLVFEGNLYDTSKEGWNYAPPLRQEYCWHFRKIKTGRQLRACLRGGNYTWPGGYAIVYLANDGAAICPDCVNTELHNVLYSIKHQINDGWRIVGVYTTAECDEEQICAHCNKVIE